MLEEKSSSRKDLHMKWRIPVSVPSYNKRVRFSWSAEHATVSHEGDRERDRPARPWTDRVIIENDLAQLYQEAYSASDGDPERSWTRFAQNVDELFREKIKSTEWDWPRATKRKSGQVVYSPRDIVDEGTLINSQSWSFD